MAYPSVQSHLHEASTLWQQLAAHLATAARTGVHVGELVAQAWLPARSPAQTCHSALTEAIAPSTGPAAGAIAKPSRPTLPRSTRPAPAAETRSAEHVLAELEALRTELYVLQIAGGFDSARQIAVTAEQLAALPEPVAKEVAGLAALPFAIIPVGAPEGREKRLALRTLAEITNAAEMSCGAVRLATPTDGRRRGAWSSPTSPSRPGTSTSN